MNMDKKTIAVIFFTIIGFSAYNYYLQSKYPDFYSGKLAESIQEDMTPEQKAKLAERSSPSVSSTESAVSKTTPVTNTKLAEPSVKLLSADDLRIETAERVFLFDQQSSAIQSILLKEYKEDMKSETTVELLDSPLFVQGSLDPVSRKPLRGFEARREGQSLIFTKQQDQFLVEQKITVPAEGYGLNVDVSFTNTSEARADLNSSVLFLQNVSIPEESGGFGPAAFMSQNKGFIYGLEGSREEELAKAYCEDGEGNAFTLGQENVDFIGFDNHYFLSVVQPKQKMSLEMGRASGTPGSAICPMSIMAYQKQGLVEPGQKISLSFSGYFGPKDVELLEAEDEKFTGTVRFGWFSVLAKPLLSAVKMVYSLVNNYGIAIIIVTILLKILFFPLTRSAAVSMKRMQKLNPEMTKLREKYKDDPQRQQKELMTFMAKHKVNPAKGCLPILPQIPVFIAFYNVLSQAIELLSLIHI